MSNVAYMRVSTKELSLENQRQVLDKYNIDKWFEDDGVSGKTTDGRDGLKKMLNFIREDDYIYVVSLDRLARNQVDQERISAEITLKGATVVPLDLMEMLGYKEVPDNGGLKFIWDMMQVVKRYTAEQERKDMLRRQEEGIKRAKQEGKYKGSLPKYRPDAKNKKDKNIYFEVIKRLKFNQPLLSIAAELGISRNTVKKIKMRANF
ncbi:recombinase family protein [Enterococcus plantarum]|uniref:recombinase family protein n=1 Tax=Enterococcus plantarum TaxID=1077675 RepID=UPI001A902AB4|nr:recombinase family protein [Enterococcus plantarum]MBO0467484.1 recombinase family protein [Enterococcus plantarum]